MRVGVGGSPRPRSPERAYDPRRAVRLILRDGISKSSNDIAQDAIGFDRIADFARGCRMRRM